MTINLKELKPIKKYDPPKVVIYGTSGIGKTTLACQFPSPIVMDVEGGLDGIEVARVAVKTYAEMLKLIRELVTQDHDFQTLVIDSIDWAESLVHTETSIVYGKEDSSNKRYNNIEDIPYGKGYLRAESIWDEFLGALSYLREKKKMAIVLVAHSRLEKFSDPSTATYDRYTLDLHSRAASRVNEWADAVLFANRQVYIKEENIGFNNKKSRGIAGDRILITNERASCLAKNRYNMPDELPLDFKELVKYLPLLKREDETQPQLPTLDEGN
jgi:hypothetical protein